MEKIWKILRKAIWKNNRCEEREEIYSEIDDALKGLNVSLKGLVEDCEELDKLENPKKLAKVIQLKVIDQIDPIENIR